jgi:hypothetical protein
VRIAQKHSNVVVGILTRIAACPRSVQHDALKALAVDFIQRVAEAFEDRVIDGSHAAL